MFWHVLHPDQAQQRRNELREKAAERLLKWQAAAVRRTFDSPAPLQHWYKSSFKLIMQANQKRRDHESIFSRRMI